MNPTSFYPPSIHPTAMMEPKFTSPAIKKLSRYSKSELTKLFEKNLQMLSNQSMIATLPDKGEKLKETNQIIQHLLLNGSTEDEITVENTSTENECPLTKKLEEMTVLTPRQGARKRSVDMANQQASNQYTSCGLLLPSKLSNGGGVSTTVINNTMGGGGFSSSIFYNGNNSSQYKQSPPPHMYYTNGGGGNRHDHAKVRMLTLDESMSLQTEQRSSVMKSDEQFDFNQPSKSLLNSLNLSLDVIQDVNINDIEFPQENEDSEEEEEEEQEVEPMMID